MEEDDLFSGLFRSICAFEAFGCCCSCEGSFQKSANSARYCRYTLLIITI